MSTDESSPQATATAATQETDDGRRAAGQAAPGQGRRDRRCRECCLVSASSFGASMAGAAMAGDKGPEGAPAGAAQTECPDGPPAGMGSRARIARSARHTGGPEKLQVKRPGSPPGRLAFPVSSLR